MSAGDRVMIIGTSSAFRTSVLREHFGGAFRDFIQVPPNIDEKMHRAPDPCELTELVARAKMRAVLEITQRQYPDLSGDAVALTFDHVVVKGDEVREKPTSPEQARYFIASYSGSTVRTVSTYAACKVGTDRVLVAHNEEEISFSEFDNDVVKRVLERGACMNSAGALIIEDTDINRHVLKIKGTSHGVRGVDPAVVEKLLDQLK